MLVRGMLLNTLNVDDSLEWLKIIKCEIGYGPLGHIVGFLVCLFLADMIKERITVQNLLFHFNEFV